MSLMKLGFVSAIVPDLSLEEVAAFASAERFQTVELMCWPVGKAERRYAGVTHIDVSGITDEQAAHIHGIMENNRISISALGYYPNLMDDDAEKRSVYVGHLRKVIDAAARLGIPVVNTFVGRMQHASVSENLAEFEKVWKPIIAHAENKGVKIGIENCPMYFSMDEWPAGQNLAYSPAIWDELFSRIPSSHFGLNYDPSHLLWQQIDYIKPIYEFKERIFHVHIKDAKVYPDKLARVGILATPLEYHSPKLPGLGDIHWGSFFSALNDIRYTGPAVIEVEDKAYEDSLESRQLAIRQSRDFLAPYIGLSR